VTYVINMSEVYHLQLKATRRCGLYKCIRDPGLKVLNNEARLVGSRASSALLYEPGKAFSLVDRGY
jgi:hypothetical protein